jgi:hypothetical protein
MNRFIFPLSLPGFLCSLKGQNSRLAARQSESANKGFLPSSRHPADFATGSSPVPASAKTSIHNLQTNQALLHNHASFYSGKAFSQPTLSPAIISLRNKPFEQSPDIAGPKPYAVIQ